MSTPRLGPDERRDATELAAGYTPLYAWVNRVGVFSASALAGLWGVVLVDATPDGVWPWLVGVAILGVLAADLLTGLIHWGCDTWGTVEVPWVGPTLIRTFREHHVDPESITRHDWAEINGEACLGATPILASLLWLFPAEPEWIYLGWWLEVFILSAMFTNQLHKWSHMAHPPAFARWLQRGRLALRPEAHRRHHSLPFVGEYCITTGWMNPLLDRLGFWRGMERGIRALTGALPRADDLGQAAAEEVERALRTR